MCLGDFFGGYPETLRENHDLNLTFWGGHPWGRRILVEIGEWVDSLKEEGSSNTSNILDIPPNTSNRYWNMQCKKNTMQESNPDQFQSSPSLRLIYKSFLIAGHDDLRLLKLH